MVNDFTNPDRHDSPQSATGAHHPQPPVLGDHQVAEHHRPTGQVRQAPNPFRTERFGLPHTEPERDRAASIAGNETQRPRRTQSPVFSAPPTGVPTATASAALLTATDHRRQARDVAAPSPRVATPRPLARSGHNRFTAGVVVGALATGIFAVGGLVGATLARPDSAPVPAITAQPATFDSSGIVPGSVHQLVTTARPSIVAIHTAITATDQFGQVANGSGAGSGWVLSADGYIVTNSHVVADATAIEVSFDDGSTATATLVGADARSDLAVLHVDRTDLTPLPLGDSDAIQVGDGVVAIGNALDLGAEPTVTGGIVSAKDRSITESTGAALVNLIQTDAAISQGNSGGPLLDLSGKVVGINTAVSGIGENIGFAISINSALDYIDELRSGQIPSHPLLGVNSAPSSDGSSGAVITDVASGTAAADAGLQVGDVIISIDGEPIDGPVDLGTAVARHRVGDSITITGTRDGADFTVTATIGAREAAAS